MTTVDLKPFIQELHRIGFVRDKVLERRRELLTYVRRFGDRELSVQLWRDGGFRVSHMLDGRGCTYPTKFSSVCEMHAAIRVEINREDHAPPEMPRRARRKRVVLRPCVALFAEEMELTLRRHDKKKGKSSWRGEPYAYLFGLMRGKFHELESARTRPGMGYLKRHQRISAEAIDLANFCMMIFDVGHKGAR